MNASWQGKQIVEKFEKLSQFLHHHKILWQQRPFYQLSLSWEKLYPRISSWLRNLSMTSIETGTWQADSPEQFQQWQKTASDLCSIGQFDYSPVSSQLAKKIQYKVPLHKRKQILRFASSINGLFPENTDNIVEWCSGKGHLGRAVNLLTGIPVSLLEIREELCQAGKIIAEKQKVEADFIPCDVMSENSAAFFHETSFFIALHACGQLHQKLLHRAVESKITGLAFSPCCYHKTQNGNYSPLSQKAQDNDLCLKQSHLRLAIMDEIKATKAEKQKRKKEMARRLSFDLLMREIHGYDRYYPIPPFSSSLLELSFKEFSQSLAQKNDIHLPHNLDYSSFEKQGKERMRIVHALGLVLHIFRRPIEIWIVLDLALYLLEKGAQVELACFCSQETTPRNLMIKAQNLCHQEH